LIVADPDELTSNLQRPRECGVGIVQEPDLYVAVGLNETAVGRVSGRREPRRAAGDDWGRVSSGRSSSRSFAASLT